MANTVRSRKAKGRGFQKEVARRIREHLKLQDFDVRSTAASVGGEDILLTPKAMELFPFSVECKNQEHIQIWQAIEQSKKNSGGRIPIVIFKRNHSEPYVAIDFESFLKLIYEQVE